MMRTERSIGAYNTLANLYLADDEVLSAIKYKEKSLTVAVNLLTDDSPRAWVQMLNNLEFYLTLNNSQKVAEYSAKLTTILARNETVSDAILNRFEQLMASAETSL